MTETRDKMIEAIFREISETQKEGGSLWDAAAAVLKLVTPERLVWGENGHAFPPNEDYNVTYSFGGHSTWHGGLEYKAGDHRAAAQAAAQSLADKAHWANTPLGKLVGVQS